MKNRNKICIILCICLVLLVGGFFFVREGKKIAETPRGTMDFNGSEEKIIFNSPKHANKYYLYDTVTGKTKKYNSRPQLPTDINDCDSEGEWFYTENYKYTLFEKYILITDRKSGEEKEIKFYLNEDDENSLRAYFASSINAVGDNIYFLASYSGDKYLCYYDAVNDKCVSSGVKNVKSYAISGDMVFALGPTEETYSLYDNNEKTTIYKRCLYAFDLEFNLKDKFLQEYKDDHYKRVISLPNSIAIVDYNGSVKKTVVSVYDLNGNIKNTLEIDGNITLLNRNEATGEYFFLDEFKRIGKLSDSKFTEISNKIFNDEHNYIPDPIPTTIHFKNGKLYYGLVSSWAGDDSYAFCCLDENGNIVTLKKEKKSFLRNFFKSDFR